MERIKILQNQEKFATALYRRHAITLKEVLEQKKVPAFIINMRRNGFIAGFLMFLFDGSFNVVVTIGHRTAMIYGLLSRLLSKKNKIHIAKEFFFEENQSVSFFKKYIFKKVYLFAFKNLSAVVVNSTGEIRPYSMELELPENLFHFIAWPSNNNDPSIIGGEGNYFLAAGRSLRDWKTFFEAIEHLEFKFAIVASRQDIQGIQIPANVRVYTDLPYNDYKDLLKKAAYVVVPLRETQRSTGQSVFLDAMALGKPVIIAKVTGALDYIEDGVNGLFYTPGDPADLREKIIRLANDPALQDRLSINGFRLIETKFNKGQHAAQMIELISGLLNTGV